MKQILALLAFAALVAPLRTATAADPAPQSTAAAANTIIGSGRVVDDERALPGFIAVRMSGPVDVRLKESTRERVIVRADDNIAPLIETRVVPGERPALEIDLPHVGTLRASRTPLVIVEFRAIEDVSMRGSGDLHADRIRSERFALSITGSGDVRIDALQATQFAAALAGSGDLSVAGHADEQGYRLTGSGDVSAAKLVGRRVIVAIAGSGDAVVHATEALEATINGTGDVAYRGSPRVVERRNGTGRLLRRH